MADKVKVVIVDESRVFRSALETALGGEDDIRITGTARSGAAAMDILERAPADAVIINVDTPDALETVQRIQRLNQERPSVPPTGVIVISSRTDHSEDMTIKALEAGVFDFVTKPDTGQVDSVVEVLHRQLAVKLRHFSSRRIFSAISGISGISSASVAALGRLQGTQGRPVRPGGDEAAKPVRPKAILIGVSTGGPKVLAQLLPAISHDVDLPILIVQHMPKDFTSSLAGSLDARCRHAVMEGRDGLLVRPGEIYIAPGGHHMRVVKEGGETRLSVTDDPPVDGCRPSVNVLFKSAAQVWGGHVIALVLTGMGSDGTKGLQDLKKAGAFVIAQDESSSVVWGMPGSAVCNGLVDKVLPVDEIAGEVRLAARGA